MQKRFIKNDNNMQSSKIFTNKHNIPTYNLKQNKNPETKYNYRNNINNPIYIPPIEFNSSDILSLYNIITIDNLIEFINENINNEMKIYRIINCWVRENYNELLQNSNKHNNYLVKILNQYLNEYKPKLSENKNLESEVIKYIDYWLKENNNMQFNLSILDDIVKYLKKKYNII